MSESCTQMYFLVRDYVVFCKYLRNRLPEIEEKN